MLTEGTKAPAFKLDGDAGPVSLADLRGQIVVLYFYPKDSTPGCTREAQAFSTRTKELAKLGAVVVGVSKDGVASHARFREKFGLKVQLLSDPDLSVHKAYGTYGEKTMYGKKVMGTIRTTFVLDEAGQVRKVFSSVKVDGHDQAVLDVVKELASGAKAAKAKPVVAKPAAAGGKGGGAR